MLSVLKRKNQRTEEEEKKQKEIEEQKVLEGGVAQATGPVKTKKSPGELRLRKEIAELDLPTHAEINFPDDNNIMVS